MAGSSSGKKLQIWDQRHTITGDAAALTTYASVGKALSCWTQFELNSSRLFARLITSSSRTNVMSPMLAFGAVRTFEGRWGMLKAAGDWFFDVQTSKMSGKQGKSELLGEELVKLRNGFDKFYKLGNGFSGRRNEIAHGMVSPWLPGAEEKRYALQPAGIESSKHYKFFLPKFAYSSTELDYYTGHFSQLGGNAASLCIALRVWLEDR